MEIIQIFFNNELRNFAYLIFFADGITVCIDPFNAKEIFSKLPSTRKIDIILNTHEHYDHHAGNSELFNFYQSKILAHKNINIENKFKSIEDSEVIYQHAEYTLISLESPGHTQNHLMFLLNKNDLPFAIFTGDCFFNAGVGNCYNGGDVNKLYQTITKYFYNYPDDLLIYPGHEYLKRNLEFTISLEYDNQSALDFLNILKEKDSNTNFFINNLKKEKEINLFLRLNSSTLRSKLNLNKDDEIFYKLRELRNKW